MPCECHKHMDRRPAVLGIDVGTASIRAALYCSKCGACVAKEEEHFTVIKVKPPAVDGSSCTEYLEQSTDELNAVIYWLRQKLASEVKGQEWDVQGVGVDATCSLAMVSRNSGSDEQKVALHWEVPDHPQRSQNDLTSDIILWADHRAVEETDLINSNRKFESIRKFQGGKVSPENQMPKLCWLWRHRPKLMEHRKCAFFDLPDYVVYWLIVQGGGRMMMSRNGEICKVNDVRSTNAVRAKWNYIEGGADRPEGWQEDLLQVVGFADLQTAVPSIGCHMALPGELVAELPISEANGILSRGPCAVAGGIIDAYAGCLPLLLTGKLDELDVEEVQSVNELKFPLIVVAGTSACHLAVSTDGPKFVPGVWGPFKDVLLPGTWVNEGGQSAVGRLLDEFVMSMDSDLLKGPSTLKEVWEAIDYLRCFDDLLHRMATDSDKRDYSFLAKDLHMTADHYGNRSPRADPLARGSAVGLSPLTCAEDCARQYLSLVQALCYGTVEIVQSMTKSGYESFDTVVICGGLTKNTVFMEQFADILDCLTGAKVYTTVPSDAKGTDDTVCRGAAVLGLSAAEQYKDIAGDLNQEEVRSTADGFVGQRLLRAAWTLRAKTEAVASSRDSFAGDRLKALHERKYCMYQKLVELEAAARAASVSI